MKRSEMIKEIEDFLFCSGYDLYHDIGNKLLSRLEELEMLPPTWIPEDDGFLWGDKPTGEPNGFKIGVNKWEPENE